MNTLYAEIEVIYKAKQPELILFAGKYVSNRADAEDIVQQVFLHLLERGNALLGVSNIQAYLLRAVHNAAISRRRKINLQQKLQQHLNVSQPHTASYEHLLEKEYRQRLARAVQLLPRQQRIVYELRCVQHWKLKKVARAMDISATTVKCHLQTVRKKITRMVA